MIELKPCEAAAFAALEQAAAPLAAGADPSAPTPLPVVVLDPGHGGADGGARGVGGVLEKTLVFEFCSELKRQLEATGRYSIAMTRGGDEYVALDDRVTMARNANAALFISVHADTLSEASDVNGSTVYTAAERASDAEAARIAARENAADQTPGNEKQAQADRGVADILFDLKRRETRAYAHIFSRGLVENLRGAARLNHNPERSAGFVVLKAPEFPSVLVELGYLSNAQDVQALSSPDWRTKTAAAMVKAIDAFFSASTAAAGAAGGRGVALGGGPTSDPGH
jgi:N-acetylmuramoyl-L-alanine amidase